MPSSKGDKREGQIPIKGAYESKVDVWPDLDMAERRRGREWSHPPWSPRPRNAHEGPWDGLYPAGYKLVRRAPHARKGLALDQNEAQTNEERQSTNIWQSLR